MTKAEIQHIRSLQDKRNRDEEGLFVAEGAKLVEEIASSTLTIRRIYTTRTDLKGANVEDRQVPKQMTGCCCFVR